MTGTPRFTGDEHAAYAAVDDALRHEPLQPAPPGLVKAVLARLPTSPRPPFRLSWMDLALGLFGTLMGAFALLGWSVLRQAASANASTDPAASAAVQSPELLILGALLTGALLIAAAAAVIGLVALVQARRPR